MRFLASEPGPPSEHWSADEWDILARLRWQRNVLLADAQVGPEHATADLVRWAGGLEDMPLIVLTQGRPIQDPNSAAAGYDKDGWTFNDALRSVQVADVRCWSPTVGMVFP